MSDNLPSPTSTAADLNYEDLLSNHIALQSSHNILQKEVCNLRIKNERWLQLFTQVEKGMSIKLAELDTLVIENHDIKVLTI